MRRVGATDRQSEGIVVGRAAIVRRESGEGYVRAVPGGRRVGPRHRPFAPPPPPLTASTPTLVLLQPSRPFQFGSIRPPGLSARVPTLGRVPDSTNARSSGKEQSSTDARWYISSSTDSRAHISSSIVLMLEKASARLPKLERASAQVPTPERIVSSNRRSSAYKLVCRRSNSYQLERRWSSVCELEY